MSNLADNIRAAVGLLKTERDEDWNKSDGKPAVDRVRELAEDPSVTRADIEAACPGVTRETEGKADAAAKLEGDDKAAAKANDEAKQTGGAAGAQAPATGGESAAQDATASGEGQSALSDVDDDDMSLSDFVSRGLLMCILLKMPKPMRIISDRDMLDDLAAFVGSFDIHEERMVVVEMIKTIAETNPADIPGKTYKARVAAAMGVVRGEVDHMRTGKASADDSKAAAGRLAAVTQGNGPPPGTEQKSALDGATDEQKAAHARLYAKK